MTVIFPTLDSYHNSNVTVISKLSAFDNIHRDINHSPPQNEIH